jgi:hypothetical protein
MCNRFENMNCKNVGFIGGCVNFPKGIDKNKVYHSLLTNALPDIKIKTDKYLTYSELIDKSEEFIKRDSIEVLFIFTRHFPYMILNKPLIKICWKNNKVKYRLHPYLCNNKINAWPKNLDRYNSEYKNNKIFKRKYFGLRDLNSILGRILGLHNWAYRYVEKCIIELSEFCISKNVKLVIIGPTKNPETFMGDRICTYLNKRIMDAMLTNNIDFIDINSYIDENNNSIFQSDKIHFNEFGHVYLFEKIRKFLQLIPA